MACLSSARRLIAEGHPIFENTGPPLKGPFGRPRAVASIAGLECARCFVQFAAMLSPTSVKDALKQTAPVAPILVQGWVRTRRDSKDFSFIELNDGSSLRNLQIIARNSLPNYPVVQGLITGAYITVRGALVASRQGPKLGSSRG